MTTFAFTTKKCVICGSENKYKDIVSTNSFGSMDLDTRPPQMMRSTLPYQIEYCENCGYANTSIDKKVLADVESIMNSIEYQFINSDKSVNPTAKAYLLSGILHSKAKEYNTSGFLYLRAAWCFDDYHNYEYAIIARKKAIEELEKYLEQTNNFEYRMIIVDLLRRTNCFDKAIKLSEHLLKETNNPFFKGILKFQMKLSNIKDAKCHTVGEV